MTRIKQLEWWFKDATGKFEKKLEVQKEPEGWMVEFYEGRIYQKEVFVPTLHNNWLPVMKIQVNLN